MIISNSWSLIIWRKSWRFLEYLVLKITCRSFWFFLGLYFNTNFAILALLILAPSSSLRFGNKFIHVEEQKLWCSFSWQVCRSPCSIRTEDNDLLWLWGCVRLHRRSRENPWRLHSTVLQWGCHKSVCHWQRPVWGLIPRRCPMLLYNLRFKKKGGIRC